MKQDSTSSKIGELCEFLYLERKIKKIRLKYGSLFISNEELPKKIDI